MKQLEALIVSSDHYEGDFCNIVNHVLFSDELEGEVPYLFRYFVNGKGSIRRGDFTYQGGIISYDDILDLEQVVATQLGVESVTILSFQVLEVAELLKDEVE